MIYDIRYRPECQIQTGPFPIGESIEEKVRRIIEDNEPIENEGLQAIYSSRGDGVIPETNIRTDKWDVAVNAMDIANKATRAQADDKEKKKKESEIALKAREGMNKEGESNPNPINN